MNYLIVAPQGLPWAARCDRLHEYEVQPPPPEAYDTLDQAIERIPVLFNEIAKQTFHPRMPIPPGSVSVVVTLLDDVLAGKVKPATKARIKREFKKHPSVPIVGQVQFWESEWAQITCLLQGVKEIEQYLQGPEAQELRQVVQSIGATAITVSGIEVK